MSPSFHKIWLVKLTKAVACYSERANKNFKPFQKRPHQREEREDLLQPLPGRRLRPGFAERAFEAAHQVPDNLYQVASAIEALKAINVRMPRGLAGELVLGCTLGSGATRKILKL